MASERVMKRMAVELKMLQTSPPPGVAAWPVNDSMTNLLASIKGPEDTVYAGGIFRLSITIPDRYPIEPPKIQFTTLIHHVNIDRAGRICLNILNMPPKGEYKPALNLCTILHSIEQLLRYPNPEDGLLVDVTHEYKHNRAAFDARARQITQQHAVPTTQQANEQPNSQASAGVPGAPAEGPQGIAGVPSGSAAAGQASVRSNNTDIAQNTAAGQSASGTAGLPAQQQHAAATQSGVQPTGDATAQQRATSVQQATGARAGGTQAGVFGAHNQADPALAGHRSIDSTAGGMGMGMQGEMEMGMQGEMGMGMDVKLVGKGENSKAESGGENVQPAGGAGPVSGSTQDSVRAVANGVADGGTAGLQEGPKGPADGAQQPVAKRSRLKLRS